MSESLQSTPNPSVYRRRRIIAGLLALIVIGGGGWLTTKTVTTLASPLPDTVVTVTQPAIIAGPATTFTLPTDGRMAIGASGFDGTLLSSGSQDVGPIASITKIVTALVVLEAKPLTSTEEGPTIEYTEADLEIYQEVLAQDGIVEPVSDGLTLSQRQSMILMLLPSANNYAISLAQWAYGSSTAFVSAANAWLAEKGLVNTRIVEPSGLSAENVSTPAELVEIGKLALSQPAIENIVSLATAEIPGVGSVVNTNKLLGEWGVDGLKTGTTDEAGACLLFSADYTVGTQLVTVVGVVLNGSSHRAINLEITELLSGMSTAFREVPVIESGQLVAEGESAWNTKVSVTAASNITVVTFSDIPIAISAEIQALQPAPVGTAVGTIDVRVGNQVHQVDALLASDLNDPGPFWKLSHPNMLGDTP